MGKRYQKLNASTKTKWRTQCSGDLFGTLIDTGDQNDDIMCLVTKSENKIEIK